jgi:hypothetical protein
MSSVAGSDDSGGTHPLLQRAQASLLLQATTRTQEVDGLLREKRNELKARARRVGSTQALLTAAPEWRAATCARSC